MTIFLDQSDAVYGTNSQNLRPAALHCPPAPWTVSRWRSSANLSTCACDRFWIIIIIVSWEHHQTQDYFIRSAKRSGRLNPRRVRFLGLVFGLASEYETRILPLFPPRSIAPRLFTRYCEIRHHGLSQIANITLKLSYAANSDSLL